MVFAEKDWALCSASERERTAVVLSESRIGGKDEEAKLLKIYLAKWQKSL